MFIDHIHLLVQAGSGGNGCESYQGRTDRKIVPDGGEGGHGGRVIFRADNNAPAIGNFRFKQRLIAESGGHGSSSHKRGRNGKDLVVLVPPGTRLYDRERKFLIRELVNHLEEVIVLEGGRGGLSNLGDRSATLGERGAELELELVFRIQADVFLVGLPNAGKSTLLNSLARTHARVEDYPFTTKSPEIGVYKISDYEHVTICELPPVYAASSEGRGVGADFLNHLEKARWIFFVLDPFSKFADSLEHGLNILKKQIEIINSDYLKIRPVVIVMKMDMTDSVRKVKEQNFKPDSPVFYISAGTGEGLAELKHFLGTEVYGSCHA